MNVFIGANGCHGEGLFYLLTVLSKDKNKHKLEEIKQYLKLFNWFEDFRSSSGLFGQQSLAIKDRFVNQNLFEIDQRSANESFLYLLFYLTLFISGYTPPFFAIDIDNIDNALNPKLCAELINLKTINQAILKLSKLSYLDIKHYVSR